MEYRSYVFFFFLFLVVLGLSCDMGMRNLSSLTRDPTHVPCIRRRILNHWAAREVPRSYVFYYFLYKDGFKSSFYSYWFFISLSKYQGSHFNKWKIHASCPVNMNLNSSVSLILFVTQRNYINQSNEIELKPFWKSGKNRFHSFRESYL